MRKIPQGASLYLAVLQLAFALGWTVYAKSTVARRVRRYRLRCGHLHLDARL